MSDDDRPQPSTGVWWGTTLVTFPRHPRPPAEHPGPRRVRVTKDIYGWVLPSRPPDRRPPRGRPSQPAYAVHAAEFERRVITSIRLLEKGDHGTPATQPRLARHLNMSLSTFKNYCRRFGINYRSLVQRVRASPP